ncbi:hypothetical protein [Alcaligenes sp. Lyrl_28]|uniref:hypothetical protein n=1 Tax=Alcaligenes sp. Lyrl_28 TaxID=3110924 RepID=UPI003F7B602B
MTTTIRRIDTGTSINQPASAGFLWAFDMTTYKTGNPLGSPAPQDLFDNSQNLDHRENDTEKEIWPDRFGRDRLTWYGIERKAERQRDVLESRFDNFLRSSGYQDVGVYRQGLEITERNQIFWRDGELYRAGASLTLPYTTTGEWAVEGGYFVAVGDAALRQSLADADGLENGAQLVGFKDEFNQKWKVSDLLRQFGPTYIQFGAIRQAVQGGGWRFISDIDHRPRGFSGQPAVDSNGDIIVNFDRGFPKVGGLLVCPDETLALFGITVGASVGLDFAAISMSKDMSLIVNLGDKTIDAETYFRPRVSIAENSDGTFTITHPPVPSGFEAPVMSPSFVGNVDARIVDFTSTTITIAPTVPLNGSVVFDGSNWNVVTAAKVKPTLSFNAGVLTVTHQPISAAQEKFALISPRKSNVPISISAGTQQGLNSFSVEFRNPTTGQLLSVVPPGAGFFYQRDVSVIAEQGSGTFSIKRGSVKLNAEDVFLENANLWILGMQIVEP